MANTLKYRPEFCAQATKLCKLGATDEQLADFFEVHRDTIFEWRRTYPEFKVACDVGKDDADNRVVQALFHRAIGYSHEAVKMFAYEGTSWSEPYTEHYPPDTTACIYWLNNRRPADWRAKVHHNHDFDKPVVIQLAYSLDDEPGKKGAA